MEEKEYFYLNGETKVGPLSLEALQKTPIRPDTMVWNNSLPDWAEARSLPELQGVFVAKTNVAEEAVLTQTNTPVTPPVQTSNMGGNTLNNPNAIPPMPENYLVWAILATIFCCWPIGIAAIINAAKVSSAYSTGDYAGAQKASDNAKKFSIWTAIGGVIFWILYIIIFVIIGVAAGLNA